MNTLGLRVHRYENSVGDDWDLPEVFGDFTVDGLSLAAALGGEITALTCEDASFRIENLRRLLGEHTDIPEFLPTFHRTRWDRLLGLRGTPVAFHESAFEDGRVGLYYCPCGDLDCGVVSARLEFTPTQVIWRDVGWQVSYEPFDSEQEGLRTYRFERGPYERVLRDLLEADWSSGPPISA